MCCKIDIVVKKKIENLGLSLIAILNDKVVSNGKVF